MNPTISVIIPCYKQAHLLPEAVRSVVAQSYTDWEIIIVDDGSPDQAAQVAEQLIEQHPDRTIRLIRQANAGLAAARNSGIKAANGRYILPLDSDDLLEPAMLAETVAILEKQPEVGFVYCDVQLFEAEQGRVSNRPYDPERLKFTCLLHTMSPFRRSAWEVAGGYRTSMGRGYEDWDFWLSLSEQGWQGYYIPAVLVRYRRTNSSKLTRDRMFDLELRAMLISNHPKLYPANFRHWAARVLSPPWNQAGSIEEAQLQPVYWWIAFLWYNLLILRSAPRELPRTLLRPLYWRMPAEWHSPIRQFARRLLK